MVREKVISSCSNSEKIKEQSSLVGETLNMQLTHPFPASQIHYSLYETYLNSNQYLNRSAKNLLSLMDIFMGSRTVALEKGESGNKFFSF